MASHPYISGPGNITQMIGYLRKNFPANVTADTVKKLGLASNNESYVINVLQFLGVIDEQGRRTEQGHAVMTQHDEADFQSSFEAIVKAAYSDLFELRADDAWTMSRGQLVGYFRNVDKTSDIIGGRQAGVFIALRELAGHQTGADTAVKPKSGNNGKPKGQTKKAKPAETMKSDEVSHAVSASIPKQQRSDMALTVRIEINLPTEGSQETYDAIFKSIRANLFP